MLGAYGCGVFRNDPCLIAAWWKELLAESMGDYFDSVFHAVLDRSKTETCIKAFEKSQILQSERKIWNYGSDKRRRHRQNANGGKQ